MTILLVSPLPPPAGGIATWTCIYSEYCQTHGIPLHIVNTALQGTRAAKKGNKRRILEEIKRTHSVLREFDRASGQRPDVVHINTSCSRLGILRDHLCVLRARRRHIPVVLQCHCNVADQLKGRLACKVFQKAAEAAAEVWVLNSASAEFVKKQTGAAVNIVPNFISENRIFPDRETRETIREAVFVGHVRREKGVVEIIEAARSFPQIIFTLAGPVQDEIAAMERPGNVVLAGNQEPEQISRYLQQADVFLFPSYTEGFANALLEAMAAGLPVIATDVGANRDMLETYGGAVIAVGKSDVICEELEKMNADPQLRKQYSSWNLEKVRKHYTAGVVLENIMNRYKEIVKQ